MGAAPYSIGIDDHVGDLNIEQASPCQGAPQAVSNLVNQAHREAEGNQQNERQHKGPVRDGDLPLHPESFEDEARDDREGDPKGDVQGQGAQEVVGRPIQVSYAPDEGMTIPLGFGYAQP
ncbi:hypothetical protein AC480_02575 [miscellaneous Crenarchaeota group archaeon SMTZ1-55]|nr:MAG: hypothetical protein AC480_02575 [miscellaneous Crenarchaeota group archaeon SMTZ1-55]